MRKDGPFLGCFVGSRRSYRRRRMSSLTFVKPLFLVATLEFALQGTARTAPQQPAKFFGGKVTRLEEREAVLNAAATQTRRRHTRAAHAESLRGGSSSVSLPFLESAARLVYLLVMLLQTKRHKRRVAGAESASPEFAEKKSQKGQVPSAKYRHGFGCARGADLL